MKFRITSVGALVVACFTMSLPSTPVRAATTNEQPEMIAHAVVAPTSPQTAGPSGLQAPYNQVPWGLDRIDQRSNTLDHSYSFSGNGAGVKVYIVDSGVNASHPEFGTRVLDGWSYRADTTATSGSYRNSNESYHSARVANNISACASNPTLQQFDPATFDDKVNAAGADTTDKGKTDNDGHGTHVAGTIGGEITGVAKGVSIVPVRVLDSCGAGTTTMVHNGLRWILADHLAGEKAVINMSIGFDASATTIDADITALLGEGIVVVAAAGNDATSACNTTPAGTAGTISVGAIQSNTTEAYYSNYGDCVDIFAPGSDIVSTWPKNGANTNTYYLETGTSMAAPHVSGVAALQLVGRTVTASTPSDIWNWLKLNSTCDVVTYNNVSASPQTANRLLNTGSTAGAACKPTSVSASVANSSVTLTWTEPASPNGSATTGYTATLSPGGQTCSTNASTFTCTISGLTANTTYTASVRAINAVGSSAQAATVDATVVAAPSAVTNVVATSGDTTLSVSWTPAAGSSGVTYTVTSTPGTATCTAVATTSCTLTGLANGTTYTVSVVASNNLGVSAVASATGTPDGPPSAPLSVTTSVGNKSITLFWPAVTNVPNVSYKVTASPGGSTCETKDTTCTFIGLQNGVSYTFELIAISGTGKVSTASLSSGRPGFTVLLTEVKKKSKTSLSKLVTTASKGKKTWSETGLCSISAGKLVAPNKVATCKVKLKVAKTSSYPAMSTTVSVSVK